MICGYARHGKDTVADIVKQRYGLKHESSSHIAMREFLRTALYLEYGLSYPSEEACYEDRVNHRDKWFNIISAYNRMDKARLAKLIFRDSDIYVGIRCREEFAAARDFGLFDLSVWVKRPGMPPEPENSNTLQEQDCDLTLCNGGSIEDLLVKIPRIFDPMVFG